MAPPEKLENTSEKEEESEEEKEESLEEKEKSEENGEAESEVEFELDEEEELAKRQFLYRGYTLEELKKMNMDEFIRLVPARIRRSLKRGLPHRHKKVLERLRKAYRAKKKGKDIVIRTHCRDMPIFPEMVGLTVGVYNGKEFKVFEILPSMIGTYLGQYAICTTHVTHGNPGIGATRSSKYVPLK